MEKSSKISDKSKENRGSPSKVQARVRTQLARALDVWRGVTLQHEQRAQKTMGTNVLNRKFWKEIKSNGNSQQRASVVLRSMLFSYYVYVNKLTDALLGSGCSSFPLLFVILAAHGYKEDWTGIVTTILQTAIVLTKRGYSTCTLCLVLTATGFLQFIFLSPEATVVDLLCIVTKRVGLTQLRCC